MNNASFLRRIAGLTIGIILGQGSIFVLQTLLMTHRQVATTASFGFAFALLSLVQWTSDWGGQILQGRLNAKDLSFDHLWEAGLAREIVTPAILACQLSFAYFYRSFDPLASAIITGGALIAPIWALNLSGFLDAHGKNDLAGPLAGFPAALAAAAGGQLLDAKMDPIFTGLTIGAAYSMGCLVCVLGQFLIAGQVAPLALPKDVSAHRVRRFLVDGAMCCLGEFPSQFYGRALLLIVSRSLGLHAAGIYVYVRQIISASAQIVLLIKRVEFFAVRKIASIKPVHLGDVFGAQRTSLAASICIFVGSLLMHLIRIPPALADVAAILPYFLGSIPIWASSVTLGQVVVVSGRARLYSSLMITDAAASGLLAWLLTEHLGLLFLAFIDFVGFSALSFSYYRVLRTGKLL